MNEKKEEAQKEPIAPSAQTVFKTETSSTRTRHPGVEHILQFFGYAHLELPQQRVSRLFGELAYDIADSLPNNPELTVALRKLLEAKDAAVRASIAK